MVKIGYEALVAAAEQEITTLSVHEAQAKLADTSVQFVDVREIGELVREGIIPGAMHVPRGMMEFWVDPVSPYFKPELGAGKSLLLFCNKGWRSALTTKTLQDMGVTQVAHIAGGFSAWKEAGGVVGVKESKTKT